MTPENDFEFAFYGTHLTSEQVAEYCRNKESNNPKRCLECKKTIPFFSYDDFCSKKCLDIWRNHN